MTLEYFINKILKRNHATTYIVELEYKYDYDEVYDNSVEVCWMDWDDNVLWFNDWNEGQTDCKVLRFIAADDVFSVINAGGNGR